MLSTNLDLWECLGRTNAGDGIDQNLFRLHSGSVEHVDDSRMLRLHLKLQYILNMGNGERLVSTQARKRLFGKMGAPTVKDLRFSALEHM